MPRQPLTALHLSRARPLSLQRQLVEGLQALIRRGALPAGEPLPSSRDLARELGVSRNTALAACDQLVAEGYLEARPRSGLFVAAALAGRLAEAGAVPAAVRAAPVPRLTGPAPFRPCQPDVRLFPLALWNRCRARALREHGPALLHYQSRHALGLPALRRALAEYLGASRGVRCGWEQVGVTAGSQQGLYLLGRLLLGPGKVALLEDPGYPGAREAFRATGAKLQALPVDAQGLVPPARLPRGAVVYVTPSRQFPTGAAMPVARRLQLLEAARAAGAWVVEDDYDSELRYARSPLPSLHALAGPEGPVLYVGTMSKVLLPTLRLGYLVLPERLVEPLARLRGVVDDQGALVDQAALAAFLDSGAFFGHLRRLRREYGARLEAFLAVAREVDAPLAFACADSGMNLLGRWTEPPPEPAALERRLERAGFELPSLDRYWLARPAGPEGGRFFGFSAFAPGAIRAAWRRLGPLLRG